METSTSNIAPNIFLFWHVPSISQIKAYKEKCELLQRACYKVSPVQIISTNNEMLTFKKIELESERFYGFNKIKGEIKKILLNMNDIKMIKLL